MKFSVRRDRGIALQFSVIAALALLGVAGCKANVPDERKSEASGATAPFMASMAVKPPQVTEDALPAEKTGGFDGKLAYEHVTKQVGFGPRPSGSQGDPASAGLHTFATDEFGLHRGYRLVFG